MKTIREYIFDRKRLKHVIKTPNEFKVAELTA